MYLYQWSVFFLSTTALICLIGLSAHAFKDNLIECLGMGILVLGCASRVSEIWARESVPPDWFMVHAGIGLYAIGAAIKVLSRAHNARFAQYQRDRGRSMFQQYVNNNTDWQEFQAEERRRGVPDRRGYHEDELQAKGHP